VFNLTGVYWIKNEARYIPEYVEFHLMQGFDHFIFYENGSNDNLLEIIKPYGDLIEIRDLPETGMARNLWLSKHCCEDQKYKSKWLDFRSLDERVFCPDGRQIPDFLKDYEQYGGVAVGWEEFNSNGHKTRPEGLIIEHYTQTCKDAGCHVKTICRPEVALMFGGNPHNFNYLPGYYTVTENRLKVDFAHFPEDYHLEKIKAHHYRTLSEEEFNVKMNKGALDRIDMENKRRAQAEDEWEYTHGRPSGRWGTTTLGFNDSLLKWVQPVRDAIAKRYTGFEYLLPYINH
jgi:hypothetical protein